MSDLLKSDIFFFVSTIAVIILTVLLIIALVYLIKILRDARYLADRAKKEGDAILDDVESLRLEARLTGLKVLNSIIKFFTRKTRSHDE
jgi:hypothetical protein